MKIVIAWSQISGYMAAAWRALAAIPDVSVFLVAFASDVNAPFDFGLLGDIRYRMLTAAEQADAALIRRLIVDEKPDVLMVSGWSNPGFRAAVMDRALDGVPKLMTMDTQPRFDARQALGRYLRRGFFQKIDRVVAAGERSAICARYLGFEGRQIRVGFCGVDYGIFGGLLDERRRGPWPRKFLFVARYAPEKAIDVLTAAYAKYRARAGADAWDLVCCGRGPEGKYLNAPGIVDMGFVPPDRQAPVFADAGAFVMPSRYEPWGVAIAEGAAAGLPLVCSDACGAAGDLLRDQYNGFLFGTDDANDLADKLDRVTRVDHALWGGRSRTLAEGFSADIWPWRCFDGYLPGQAAACHGSA